MTNGNEFRRTASALFAGIAAYVWTGIGGIVGAVIWLVTAKPQFLVWGLGGGLLLVTLRSFHRVRQERDALLGETKPKVDIVFPEGRLYQQVDPAGDRTRVAWYRVGLHNRSSTQSIPSARIVLEQCEPTDGLPAGYLPAVMRFFSHSCEATSITLTPDTTEVVDIATGTCVDGDQTTPLTLLNAHVKNHQRLTYGTYRLTLRAEGANTAPVRKTFILDRDKAGLLIMREDVPPVSEKLFGY